MKKINTMFLGFLLLTFCLVGCLGEGDDLNCPEGCYLQFKPKNYKHNLKAQTNTLDLYLYTEEGQFYKLLQYTANDFSANNSVFVPRQPDGSYKIIAAINHNPDFYDIADHHSYQTVHSILKHEECITKQDDLFVGLTQLAFSHNDETTRTQEIFMGKQTNHININIIFDGYEQTENTILKGHIYGDNGVFAYSNYKNKTNNYRIYRPHNQNSTTEHYAMAFAYTTMGLWTDADITFILKEVNGTRTDEAEEIRVNLIEEFKKLKDSQGNYLYDSDERFEHQDEYALNITLGAGFVATAISVSSEWSLIEGDVEIHP